MLIRFPFRTELKLALAQWKAKPFRFILTALGIALGVALYTSIAIINYSTRESFRESIESVAGEAALTISAGPVGFDEKYLDFVREVSGVKAAIPLVESRAFFSGATDSSESLQILGVDMLQEAGVRSYRTTDEEILEDPLLFLNNPDSIILTKVFAEKHKLNVDDPILLATAEGKKTFVIRGLLEPEGAARAYGGSLAIMDIDGARFSFGKAKKIDRIDVTLKDGVSVEGVRAEIAKKVPETFTIETPELKSQQTDKMLKAYQVMLVFFSSLALLVGLFLVLNTVSISVAERKSELGILRALGADRAFLIRMFLAESLGMGVIGGLLGCVIGRGLAVLLMDQVTASLTAQFQTQFNLKYLVYPFREYLFVFLLSIAVSVVGALWPAYKAMKTSPLEAIRPEEALHGRSQVVIYYSVLGVLFYGTALIGMRMGWNQGRYPFLEHVIQACSILGAGFLVPALSLLGLQLFRNSLKKIFGLLPHLAQQQLSAQPQRTAANLMALSIGLFMVVLIATVKVSFKTTLMNWIGDALSSDIVISSAGKVITADLQAVDEKIADVVRSIEGVESNPTGGIGSRILMLESGESKGKYVIKANDAPGSFLERRSKIILAPDSEKTEILLRLYQDTRPKVLASDNYFLHNQNKKVGDSVELSTPTGKVEFEIVGKVRDFASPVGVFYMNRETYKRYFNDSLVTAFAVNVKTGFDPEKVRSAIDQSLSEKYGLQALSQYEMRDQMGWAVDRSFAYTKAVELSALFVSLLGLLNTLLISVLERMRHFGILRAVGATRGQVFGVILLESFIQGILGATLATFLGLWVGVNWVKHSLAHALGWLIDAHIPWSGVAMTLFFGVMVALLAGIYPAWKVSRLYIVKALGRSG